MPADPSFIGVCDMAIEECPAESGPFSVEDWVMLDHGNGLGQLSFNVLQGGHQLARRVPLVMYWSLSDTTLAPWDTNEFNPPTLDFGNEDPIGPTICRIPIWPGGFDVIRQAYSALPDAANKGHFECTLFPDGGSAFGIYLVVILPDGRIAVSPEIVIAAIP